MPNHLVSENSPYLLQHANNPVDWYPWGEEALNKARTENKPIFLSIGYAACHWCHVMEHESFEDPDTASFMNENFINIKVDREERPDIDSVYMQATVAMTGSGGWPMSVFLTPDLKPFYAGTYFPPVRRYNMPSFKEVLSNIAKAWREDVQEVDRVGNQVLEHIRPPIHKSENRNEITTDALEAAIKNLIRILRLGIWRLGLGAEVSATHDHRISFTSSYHRYTSTRTNNQGCHPYLKCNVTRRDV